MKKLQTNPNVGEPKNPTQFILVQNQTLTFMEASSSSTTTTMYYDVPSLLVLGSFSEPPFGSWWQNHG
jgi:hypothetical protein